MFSQLAICLFSNFSANTVLETERKDMYVFHDLKMLIKAR